MYCTAGFRPGHVSDGSKAVNLSLSTCFPLRPQKATSVTCDACVTGCIRLDRRHPGWFGEKVEEIDFVADRGFARDAGECAMKPLIPQIAFNPMLI